MKHVFTVGMALALSAALCAPPAHAAGDPVRGARIFQQCMACHSIQPGRHLTGPSLAGVWERKAGTAEGFLRYSDALQNAGITWNARSLDRWLADPQALVAGTSMAFPGLRSAEARADVIAYLHAVSEGKAPRAPGAGGMMGSSGPADLRQAGADALVRSLHHCHDTYIVRTAAGPVRKIWEYNVRLKTDSSPRGPAAGKPVIVGSGMRGDRVSIVFASPGELGRFILESCD